MLHASSEQLAMTSQHAATGKRVSRMPCKEEGGADGSDIEPPGVGNTPLSLASNHCASLPQEGDFSQFPA